jgi:hypothetical protein
LDALDRVRSLWNIWNSNMMGYESSGFIYLIDTPEVGEPRILYVVQSWKIAILMFTYVTSTIQARPWTLTAVLRS